MKTDCLVFSKLPFAHHFNFAEGSRGDPFLIQSSVQGNIVAGNDVRAIKRGKVGDYNHKKVLPLAEDDMAKAKACEEMLMFERGEKPSRRSHNNGGISN